MSPGATERRRSAAKPMYSFHRASPRALPSSTLSPWSTIRPMGNRSGEGRQAADVVGVEVRDQQVVDAVDARVVHGRLDAQGVARVAPRPAGVHQHRLAGGRDHEGRRAALDVDPVDVQVGRLLGEPGQGQKDQQRGGEGGDTAVGRPGGTRGWLLHHGASPGRRSRGEGTPGAQMAVDAGAGTVGDAGIRRVSRGSGSLQPTVLVRAWTWSSEHRSGCRILPGNRQRSRHNAARTGRPLPSRRRFRNDLNVGSVRKRNHFRRVRP